MMERRGMVFGLVGVLVTPAIVRGGSLMAISSRHQPAFFISMYRMRDGKRVATVLENYPMREYLDMPAAARAALNDAIRTVDRNFAADAAHVLNHDFAADAARAVAHDTTSIHILRDQRLWNIA